jgi:hypothetical protein
LHTWNSCKKLQKVHGLTSCSLKMH